MTEPKANHYFKLRQIICSPQGTNSPSIPFRLYCVNICFQPCWYFQLSTHTPLMGTIGSLFHFPALSSFPEPKWPCLYLSVTNCCCPPHLWSNQGPCCRPLAAHRPSSRHAGRPNSRLTPTCWQAEFQLNFTAFHAMRTR